MSKNVKTLHLHVGLPKTGTTSIQEFLKKNHDYFESNGVGVLSVDGEGAHHLLAQNIIKLDYPDMYLDGYFLGHDQLFDNFFVILGHWA